MNLIEQVNRVRWRAVQMSRAYKQLFLADEQKLRRSSESVLADLREYCFAQKSTFHTDALTMAKREGRREVWMRLTKFLNLDESQVQQLMETDDGL